MELAEARERLKMAAGTSANRDVFVDPADLRLCLAALDRAGEALGPFAAFLGRVTPLEEFDDITLVPNGRDTPLTYGHFRLAAQVHQDLTGGGERG